MAKIGIPRVTSCSKAQEKHRIGRTGRAKNLNPLEASILLEFLSQRGDGVFLKNGFFFSLKNGFFFHIWSTRLFFFNFISLSVCWDYIKEIQGTILPSLATLPAEAPTRS